MNNSKKLFRLLSLLLTASLFTISCENEKQVKMPPPQITVVEVQQQDVPIYKEFVGQVYGYSDIPIRARVIGFLEGIHFREGLQVSKGQLLYTIDPSEYQSKVATQQSHLAEAKTDLAKSKSDLDRIKPLAEINAVSKSDLDAAQANYDASLAYVDAMKANLKFANINLSYCWIKSPINGIIGKTQARVGEFVGQDPNPVILNTVSTVDKIRVEFYLTEANYIRLARAYEEMNDIDRNDTTDRDHLSLILADGSTFKHKGFVSFINREVDAQTGSLLVQAVFPNPDRLLKPGQYSKVVVMIREIKGALLIPQRCITELQGQYSIFTVDDKNIIQSKQIEVSHRIGDMRIVTSGLEASDKIVIDALQKVGTGIEVIPQVIVFESKSNLQY